MARKVDIVDFNPSDGLTPLQIKKLNWNFKRLFDALGGVDIDQAGSVKSFVLGTHDLAVDQKATVVKKGTKNNVIVEVGIPAAQVSITDAQVDDVLANNAPTGTQVLRLSQLSRLWAGIKQYVDNAIGAIGAFVLKAGDTMTGTLTMNGASVLVEDGFIYIDDHKLDRDDTENSQGVGNRYLYFRDKDNMSVGNIVGITNTNANALQFQAYNKSGTGKFMRLWAFSDTVRAALYIYGKSQLRVGGGLDSPDDVPWVRIDSYVANQASIRFNPGSYDGIGIYTYNYDANGGAMMLYSGGAMIVGGGESPTYLRDNIANTADTQLNGSYGTERLFLTADGNIVLYPNANTWAQRAQVIFDTSGNLILMGRKFNNATNTRASLYIQNPLSAATKAAQNGLTASQYNEVFFRDKNSNWLGTVSQAVIYNSGGTASDANAGASRVFLQSRMMKTDETWATNHFSIYTRKDGSAHYSCGSAANFRSDLGINNAANLTTGTLPIDRLPTVTVAKGGTGATSAANARTNLGVAYTSLYNNATGTNGTVTLSETAANFTHLLIIYKWYPTSGLSDKSNRYFSRAVRAPNGKIVALPIILYEDGGATGLRNNCYKISGTSITYQKSDSGSSWFSGSSQNSSSQGTTSAVEIVSVMGYKY